MIGLSYSGPYWNPTYHNATIKFNTNGDTLWVRRYTGGAANSLAVDAGGNVYVTGASDSNIVTIKYNGAGNEEWVASYSYGVGSKNLPVGIKVDPSGNVYVAGTSSFGNTSVYTVIKYVQTPTSVREISPAIPSSFALEENYPNPFNPTTAISYQLSANGLVSLKVFNLLGQEVAVLVNEEKPAGTYRATWDAGKMPSGVYFYRLNAGEFVETKKMILLR